MKLAGRHPYEMAGRKPQVYLKVAAAYLTPIT